MQLLTEEVNRFVVATDDERNMDDGLFHT
jgi:hypothetical protein